MAKPQLIYDANCPVCTTYIAVLKKKVSPSELEYIPNGDGLDDFQYINSDGITFDGNEAIDAFSADYPQIKHLFFMLPEKYRTLGLKALYAAAGAARNVYKAATRGGCGCGKKK
jgi:hypothetical protein